MPVLRDSVLTTEAYAKVCDRFRRRLIAYQRKRRVQPGNHQTYPSANETTIRYHIQEMLYIEKFLGEQGIAAELEPYLPLRHTAAI
jgi:archaellum component FlaD/FlaE